MTRLFDPVVVRRAVRLIAWGIIAFFVLRGYPHVDPHIAWPLLGGAICLFAWPDFDRSDPHNPQR